jgi:hypothetical protein
MQLTQIDRFHHSRSSIFSLRNFFPTAVLRWVLLWLRQPLLNAHINRINSVVPPILRQVRSVISPCSVLLSYFSSS